MMTSTTTLSEVDRLILSSRESPGDSLLRRITADALEEEGDQEKAYLFRLLAQVGEGSESVRGALADIAIDSWADQERLLDLVRSAPENQSETGAGFADLAEVLISYERWDTPYLLSRFCSSPVLSGHLFALVPTDESVVADFHDSGYLPCAGAEWVGDYGPDGYLVIVPDDVHVVADPSWKLEPYYLEEDRYVVGSAIHVDGAGRTLLQHNDRTTGTVTLRLLY